MKQCPKCKSTYSDESLSFCLADGTPLLEVDSEKTQQMSASERKAMQIEIPTKETETVAIPYARPTENSINTKAQPTRKGVSPLIVGLLVTLLFFLMIGFAAFAAFAAYTYFGNKNVVENDINSKDKDVDKLKDEIANLKEKINGQSENPSNTSTQKNSDSTKEPPELKRSAKVNSPNDGFLALRSLPNHKKGSQITKIPHGTDIQIGICQSNRIKIGSKTGRWCQANYKGMNGWVFDAWLSK